MSWNVLPPEVREIAKRELTEKQLEAFKLELAGMSLRGIASALDIDRRAVRDRLDAAYRRLRRAGVRQTSSGGWILDEKEAA